MSAENVQIIRRLVEAFNDRDLDAMFAVLHPEAELHPLRAQLEGKAYRGPRRAARDARRLRPGLGVRSDGRPSEFREAGDEVVVLGRLRARGRASGIGLDVPMGFVWTLRDGKVVHAKTFSEQADALRAAGLE